MTPLKVLLAEDDADDRIFFREFLQDRPDLNILTPVENGIVLMEFLDTITDAAGLPDIIILDQNMPLQNGFQTLSLLKADQRYADIPVMIYSTYTDERLIKACMQMGVAAVVTKPTTPSGYQKMIDRFLKIID